MHLVYDIDFKPRICGSKGGFLSELSYKINAVVACGIDFLRVKILAICVRYACGTSTANIAVLIVFATDSVSENPRNRGFSGAPRSAKKIGMTNSVRRHLVFKGGDNMLLSHDVGKRAGTIFSVKCSIHIII